MRSPLLDSPIYIIVQRSPIYLFEVGKAHRWSRYFTGLAMISKVHILGLLLAYYFLFFNPLYCLKSYSTFLVIITFRNQKNPLCFLNNREEWRACNYVCFITGFMGFLQKDRWIQLLRCDAFFPLPNYRTLEF